MGHVIPTPAGTYRANWRDATGKQRAKTFPTRKQAKAFLAETESTLTRGTYVDPHAGRARFAVYAVKWAAGRNDEKMTRRPRFVGHAAPGAPYLGRGADRPH